MGSLRLLGLLATLSLTTSSVVKSPSKNEGAFELLILHNNDMHARFEQTSQLSGACTTADRDAGKCYGGFPRVAHVVKEARAAAASGEGPPVLYLNAGDTYTGTAWFTIYKWKIAAEFINALQPDAVSLGNHEFDNGVSGLVPFIEKLTCPVVAANLVLDNVPELEQVVNLRKSIIISVGDAKVGVIGYLTPDTKIFARPNEVLYIREIDAIRVEVTKLKENGIKIIIALGHSGYATDLDVAKEVEGIDLVIGGHTHTFLWNGTRPDTEDPVSPYPTYVKNSSGKMVPVVQAYAYTKYLGKLHITFDREGEVINLDGEPILLDMSIPQDMEVLNIINRYKNDSMDTLNDFEDIVGNASVVLDGQTCKRAECNLGNLISDAMIYAYASKCIGEHWIDSSIALLDGGSIRSSIDHAELPTTISKADIFAVMPFEDKLVKITMNGSILLNLLEHAVANYDSLDDPRVFLQHSGLRVIYDIKRPPGARVVKAKARCSVCDIPTYYPIMPADVYNVITVDFIAGGGDGYSMLVGLRNEDFGYTIRMAIEDYIRHYGVIYPKLEERITML